MAVKNLQTILRDARVRAGLSQLEVALKLGLNSPQSISDWERGAVGSIPIPSLKQLVKLYRLDAETVFDALLAIQTERLHKKLHAKFFGAKTKRSSRSSKV